MVQLDPRLRSTRRLESFLNLRLDEERREDTIRSMVSNRNLLEGAELIETEIRNLNTGEVKYQAKPIKKILIFPVEENERYDLMANCLMYGACLIK